MKVVTGDVLVDISGHNVSEYLLFTSDRLRLHRYPRSLLVIGLQTRLMWVELLRSWPIQP